jgi:hypothetical protein
MGVETALPETSPEHAERAERVLKCDCEICAYLASRLSKDDELLATKTVVQGLAHAIVDTVHLNIEMNPPFEIPSADLLELVTACVSAYIQVFVRRVRSGNPMGDIE